MHLKYMCGDFSISNLVYWRFAYMGLEMFPDWGNALPQTFLFEKEQNTDFICLLFCQHILHNLVCS